MTSVLFITDFDGTLTKKDTTHLSFRSTKKFRYGTQSEQNAMLQEIKKLGENYYDNYKRLIERLLRQTNTDFGSTDLQHFLTAVDTFNLDSRCNLAKQKYFDDFVYENVEELKQEIEFHPRALETLETLHKQKDIDCKILSVNWFPELLHACVGSILPNDDVITARLPVLKDDNVDFGDVSSAYGKAEWIQKWKTEYTCCSVYVGDTLTDLPALLEADYGVVFGSNKEFFKVTSLYNVQILPLSCLLEKTSVEVRPCPDDTNTNEKLLYSTNSWDDVGKLVQSLR